MEKIFIDQLKANQTISSTFLVKSKELRNKKTGGQFALITLADKTVNVMAPLRFHPELGCETSPWPRYLSGCRPGQ